jgi:hypothetical protein
MSRLERFNCAVVAIGLAVLLFLFGMLLAPQPSNATTATPLPDTVAADSITVDGEPEPSGVDGMTVDELLHDAWTTYQATIPTEAPHGAYTTSPEYAASYLGTPPAFPADYLSIESTDRPGVFHVFRMVASQRA